MLIERYFLRGKTLSEIKAKLDKHYSDSAPSHGMVQKLFVVVVRAQKPYQVQVVQMISLHQMTSKFMSLFNIDSSKLPKNVYVKIFLQIFPFLLSIH